MYFGQIFVKSGRILVRFSGKIGPIVSQILETFSQILIISTMPYYKTLRILRLQSEKQHLIRVGNIHAFI